MARKIASASALLVFAVSILLGLRAQNTFSTTLLRALQAMGVTFVIGLMVGTMAEKMMEENLSDSEKKLKNSEAKIGAEDR